MTSSGWEKTLPYGAVPIGAGILLKTLVAGAAPFDPGLGTAIATMVDSLGMALIVVGAVAVGIWMSRWR